MADRDVPAGTSRTPTASAGEASGTSGDVPAGTSPSDIAGSLTYGTCHVEGVGSVEAETARRLACDSDLLGSVVDAHGDVLALGRTRRLVSRAQRRALMIRDGMCQFPGCHQTRHLDAHHRVAWAQGGPTDLDNLLLLCQWHHTAVHEGGMGIHRIDGEGTRWRFVMPDDTPHRPWWDAATLARLLAEQARQRTDDRGPQAVTSFDDAVAQTIRPRWAGEPFDLHACVEALFTMRLPEERREAA